MSMVKFFGRVNFVFLIKLSVVIVCLIELWDARRVWQLINEVNKQLMGYKEVLTSKHSKFTAGAATRNVTKLTCTLPQDGQFLTKMLFQKPIS